MSRRPARAVLGNALVLLALLVIAALLLRLHLDDGGGWTVPRPLHWPAALASVLLYAAGCTWLWWRTRPREDAAEGEQPLLLVWASQTGFALALAHRSAHALAAAGVPVRMRGLHQVDAGVLAQHTRALFIASTTGEGDAPDHALPFLRRTMREPVSLDHLQYGVLALGDSSYAQYCAFGHQLDGWLRRHGAHALFDTVQVDNGDTATLRHWQQLLGQLGNGSGDQPDWSPVQYQPWRLAQRTVLNAGSPGAPVFHLRLQPPSGTALDWQAGDIAEIGPRHARQTVQAWLQRHGHDGQHPDGHGVPLAERLAGAHLPDAPPASAAALLASLQPLPHREYSIASVPADGMLDLLVRRQQHPDGSPGLGSGWLCEHLALGGHVDVRLRSNPNFHGVDPTTPLLLIGNGTGIAGLRAHLHARAQAGARRTWLLFGERTRQHDFHFQEELQALLGDGTLQHLDTTFSRDGGEHRYVQHLLQAHAGRLQQWVAEGATILVCGSLQGMAPAVDAVIEQALGREGRDALLQAGRYRRDVY